MVVRVKVQVPALVAVLMRVLSQSPVPRHSSHRNDYPQN